MPNLQAFSEETPYNFADSFTSADTTVAKDIFPARDQLARIDAILFSNSDSVSHSLTVTVNTVSGDGLLGTVFVPGQAGHAGNAPFDILKELLPSYLNGWVLLSPQPMQAAMTATLPGGVTLNFISVGGTL